MKSEFGKNNIDETQINVSDYLSGGNNLHIDNVPVPYTEPLSVERAQEATEYFLSFSDVQTQNAYSYIKKSIEDRANHYQLEGNKSPIFFNEQLRFTFLKSSLIRELEKMNALQNEDDEERWWSGTFNRYSSWILLCLSNLDNKNCTAADISLVTGKSHESSRITLREAEERGYCSSKMIDGTRHYKTSISTVNKYYKRIRKEIRRCSLESLVRQTSFKTFVEYEEQFVKAFNQKKDF